VALQRPPQGFELPDVWTRKQVCEAYVVMVFCRSCVPVAAHCRTSRA
jgi:hypothetical protein